MSEILGRATIAVMVLGWLGFSIGLALRRREGGGRIARRDWLSLVGILLPSSLLTLSVTRWTARHREARGVRAFTTGMAPLTLGLLLATGWVLADPLLRHPDHRLTTLVLVGVTIAAMLRSKLSPMWLIALGAVVGGAAMR